jgi:hypothetical protein
VDLDAFEAASEPSDASPRDRVILDADDGDGAGLGERSRESVSRSSEAIRDVDPFEVEPLANRSERRRRRIGADFELWPWVPSWRSWRSSS